MKKAPFVLSLILLLSGCSLFQTPISPYPDGIPFPLEKAGEFIYDGEIIDLFQKKDDRIYFTTRKGFIYCIDALDYKLQWRSRLPEVPKSPVFIGRSHIFVFDGKNNVYCFDLDGNDLWQIGLKEEITSPLAEIGNSVFLGTSQGSFIAIDVLSGNEAWHFMAQEAIRSNPVEFEGQIIFGCDDHHVYFLDPKGTLVDKYLAKDKIFNTLLVDGKYLYFGTENHFLVCLDLKKKIKKWEVKTGGGVLPIPISDEKRVFFLARNNVLYCLNKGNGSIIWWKPIPSRSPFQMELSKEEIVVSSLSSILVCFNVETGARVGIFDVGKELKSNPLWNAPFLLANVYDRQTEKGKIIQMKKAVQVSLVPSVVSPQFVNQEIAFTVTNVGFHVPQYEFHTKIGEETKVVQAASDKSTWSWFPSQPGPYTVGVTVSDEKINRQSEIPFVIEKIESKVSLYPSKSSPQGIDEKIIFNAGSSGFIEPLYELRISRVNLVLIGKRSVLSIVEQNGDDTEVEYSESENWTWTPKNRGLYMICLTASDDSEQASVSRYFLILSKDELKKIIKIKKESAS
ncbi:PQQ-binding-like beta-propeller repeat protein [Acidobacteriota bacterium]